MKSDQIQANPTKSNDVWPKADQVGQNPTKSDRIRPRPMKSNRSRTESDWIRPNPTKSDRILSGWLLGEDLLRDMCQNSCQFHSNSDEIKSEQKSRLWGNPITVLPQVERIKTDKLGYLKGIIWTLPGLQNLRKQGGILRPPSLGELSTGLWRVKGRAGGRIKKYLDPHRSIMSTKKNILLDN